MADQTKDFKAILDVAKRAQPGINLLWALSRDAKKGDKSAMFGLHTLATFATYNLGQAAEAHPEAARELAAKLDAWPVIGRRGKVWKGLLDQFYQKIGLGEEIACLSQDQLLSHRTEAREIVYYSVQRIQFQKTGLRAEWRNRNDRKLLLSKFCNELATAEMPKLLQEGGPRREKGFNNAYLSNYYEQVMRLKELSPTTVDEWFRCIRRFVTFDCQGIPEHEDFGMRWMGKNLEKKGDAAIGTATAESNIREGIFKRVRTTLKNMVKQASASLPMQSDGKIAEDNSSMFSQDVNCFYPQPNSHFSPTGRLRSFNNRADSKTKPKVRSKLSAFDQDRLIEAVASMSASPNLRPGLASPHFHNQNALNMKSLRATSVCFPKDAD